MHAEIFQLKDDRFVAKFSMNLKFCFVLIGMQHEKGPFLKRIALTNQFIFFNKITEENKNMNKSKLKTK